MEEFEKQFCTQQTEKRLKLYRKGSNLYIPVSKNDKCYIANSVIGIAPDRETINAISQTV